MTGGAQPRERPLPTTYPNASPNRLISLETADATISRAVRISGIGLEERAGGSDSQSLGCSIPEFTSLDSGKQQSNAMSLADTSFKVTGFLAGICLVLAVCTVWIVLTDPVTVATAVDTHDLSSIFGLLTRAVTDALRAVVRYL